MKVPIVNKRPGSKFIAALPHGFDDRTRICFIGGSKFGQCGMLIAAHPEQSPVLVNLDTGTVEQIKL
jgi:hypothetical protein